VTSCPENCTRPDAAVTRPVTCGPRSTSRHRWSPPGRRSPFRHGEGHIEQGAVRAVPGTDVLHNEDVAPVWPTPRPMTQVGVAHQRIGHDLVKGTPSASMQPRSITTVRSTTSPTMDRSCSTRSTAVPRSRCTVRSTAARSAVSCRSSPEDGSSASRIFGSAARARASSTRRQLPRPSALTDVHRPGGDADQLHVTSTLLHLGVRWSAHVEQVLPEPPSPRRARSATIR
jgi:hypothetical protein